MHQSNSDRKCTVPGLFTALDKNVAPFKPSTASLDWPEPERLYTFLRSDNFTERFKVEVAFRVGNGFARN